MTDLIQRPRRLRKSPALRAMFEETTLSLNDLVLPIFVEEEIDDYKAVEAMPGVMRIPEKHLAREIERIANAGIRSVMTFGISHHTDETGSDAWREDGLVARMSRICKQTVPEMIVMSDTCFCEYTSHGHCGVLCEHGVDNDATLENLGKQAVVAAAAGADFIAPSAAMDGQVQAIRQALDAAGFKDTAIMSYSTKFASSFYGPFREAAGSALKRRPQKLSDGLRQRAGGAAGNPGGYRGGGGHCDGQTGPRLSGCSEGGGAHVRYAACSVQCERGVRHGKGGGRAGVD